jgi:hypothetical protein
MIEFNCNHMSLWKFNYNIAKFLAKGTSQQVYINIALQVEVCFHQMIFGDMFC